MFQSLRTRPHRSVRLRFTSLEDRCVPANFAPVISALNAQLTTTTGATVKITGTFNDTDANDPHSVIIDWRDGSTPQTVPLAVGGRSFEVTHLYTTRAAAMDKVRTATVVVTDQAFAGEVVGTSGTFDNSGFRQPGSVLGEPTRFTDPSGPYGGAVTPFNAPFGGNEILMLNAGESVTVKFAAPVHDRPFAEHFGADFLVFGNAFYHLDFNTLKATGGVFSEPGQIEVSQDGVNFFPISAFADTAFPTNGYRNPTGPFDQPPTNPILSDFGLPVNLSFNETGLTLNQIVAAYNGSGGGTPVDISSTGLPWIQYVRVHGATDGVELDAFSVVNPLPAATTVSTFNLAEIDESLGLYVAPSGFYQGASGVNFKWLLGSVANKFGNGWYILRNNGDFFAWNGLRSATGSMVASGALLFRFQPDVFVHPETLYNASQAVLSPAEAAVAQNLDETLGLFVGPTGFRNGTYGPTFKWLRGQINSLGSNWYYIDRNGDLYAWVLGKKALIHDFDAQLHRDPQLLFDASQATLSPSDAMQAQQFDTTLGLFVDAAGFFPTVQNMNAKWLRGQPNASNNVWYFIRSNGEFVAWDGRMSAGRKVASGTVLYQFDPEVFLDPQLLYQSAFVMLPSVQVVEARQLQENLGLFIDAKGFFAGASDTSVKWLRGQPNQFGATWYFVRANGEFVAWNKRLDSVGRRLALGTTIYQFDPQVFLNPEMLL